MNWDDLSPEDKQDYLDTAKIMQGRSSVYKDMETEEVAKLFAKLMDSVDDDDDDYDYEDDDGYGYGYEDDDYEDDDYEEDDDDYSLTFDELTPDQRAAFEHLAQIFKDEWKDDPLGELDLRDIATTIFEAHQADDFDDYKYLLDNDSYDADKYDSILFADDVNGDKDTDVMLADTNGDGEPNKAIIDADSAKEYKATGNIVKDAIEKAKQGAKEYNVPRGNGTFVPETPEEKELLDSTGMQNVITSALLEHRF